MSLKVGVAGGFGFLGTHITRRLEDAGYETIPFSRRSGVDILVRNPWSDNNIIDFLGDSHFDVVINCAATAGGISYNSEEPVLVYNDNLMIGYNLTRYCCELGVGKLVHAVPNCVYPGIADIYRESEWMDGALHETVQVTAEPRRATWVQSKAYRDKYGFNSIHIVLPNMYGPCDHFDPVRSHALGALIRKIVDAKVNDSPSVTIWGTGTPIREWGYVEDMAEGLVLAMELYDDGNIMNIGSGEGHSIMAIASIIRGYVGWDGTFTYDRSKPDGAPKKVLDVSRMEEKLDWRPSTGIHEGIRKTVAWYMSTHGS